MDGAEDARPGDVGNGQWPRAWVFEWTPEGLKLDADAGADADDAAVSKRKLDRIILVP